jgi:NADH dehydrogenase/NADH:ubiquinone oxidoreductase subunit G
MEHALTEKQAKIESLQDECKKTRRVVQEKERALNFFGRDVQRLVNTTDPAALREGIKAIYRSIVKGTAEISKEDEEVQAEFASQREYMERALDALKTRVGRTEHQTKLDFQRKVAENEQLITECNQLRKETRELRQLLDKAQNELQNGRPELKASASSLDTRRAPSAQKLLRPSTAGDGGLVPRPLGATMPAGGARPLSSQKAAAGTLLKGSAGAMGRERARTAEVLMTLEGNNREMQMQRSEIMRLREQVALLSGSEGAASEGAAAGPPAAASEQRPVSSQDRPIKHSPMPRPPRAASALD